MNMGMKERMMRKSEPGRRVGAPRQLLALLVLVPGVLLAGCNTTRGIGKDVKSVGTAIERAVD
jgi:predicted small secreted protein